MMARTVAAGTGGWPGGVPQETIHTLGAVAVPPAPDGGTGMGVDRDGGGPGWAGAAQGRGGPAAVTEGEDDAGPPDGLLAGRGVGGDGGQAGAVGFGAGDGRTADGSTHGHAALNDFLRGSLGGDGRRLAHGGQDSKAMVRNDH